MTKTWQCRGGGTGDDDDDDDDDEQGARQAQSMGIDESFDDEEDCSHGGSSQGSSTGRGRLDIGTLMMIQQQRRQQADADARMDEVEMDESPSPEYVAESLLANRYPDLLEFLHNSLLPVYRRWFPVQADGSDDSDPSNALRRILELNRLMDDRTGQPLISDNQGQLSRLVLEQIAEDESSVTSFSTMLNNHDKAATDSALKKTRVVVSGLTEKMLRILYNARLFHQTMTCMLEDMSPKKLPYTLNFLGEHKFFREMFIFQPISSCDLKDERAKVVMFLLWQFHQFRWKKKHNSDFIYQEVTYRDPDTRALICTRAYEPKFRIEEAIYSIIQKEQRADLFASIIKRNVVADIAQFLIKGSFVEFPYISVKETMYSFLDGVWEADTDRFEYYESLETTFPEVVHQDHVTYKFFKHKFAPVYYAAEDEEVPPTTAGYLPFASPGDHALDMLDDPPPLAMETPGSPMGSEFEDPGTVRPSPFVTTRPHRAAAATGPRPRPRRKMHWREIQNPRFEKIFNDQGWTPRSVDLKYATMGRTLWPSGTKDNCQYITVDIGESATGKSTAQIIWQNMFHFQDVMIFGANQEDRFGRDKLPDKRIFLAPDMRGDSFGITPEFFLVLAGNDAGVFPVKYGDPRHVEHIRTPGMLATNELPPAFRNDIRGSVHRRLLPFGYPKTISPRNPMLKEEILKHEIPGILRKSVLAYFDETVHPHDRDIMTNYDMPLEIQNERNKLLRASSSLIDFLLSPDYVKVDEPDEMCCKAAFVKLYVRFCKEIRQQRACNFHEDFYKVPFELFHLELCDLDGDIVIRGCRLVMRPSAEDEE